MVGGMFAVALSWMRIKIRCPVYMVHDKTTEDNGLTLSSPYLNN